MISLSTAASFAAAAMPAAALSQWGLPELASRDGAAIDSLFRLIFWITLAVGVAVEAILVWFVLRYRNRPAHYTHGSSRLEIAWTAVPLLILVALSFTSQRAWASLKSDLFRVSDSDRNAFVVMVRPQQFQWNITYPGADQAFDTADDIRATNQLHLPLDRDVVVRLRARDVIHSFFLPEMRVKQDALPNQWVRVRFHPVKAGKWEITCAELCGLGHYQMRGFYTVEPQASLDAWLAAQKKRQEQ